MRAEHHFYHETGKPVNEGNTRLHGARDRSYGGSRSGILPKHDLARPEVPRPMKSITFIVPPHLQFRDYVDPKENVKAVRKPDGRAYGNLITDMPLGPLAMSAYLKEHVAGLETGLLDFNIELNRRADFPFDSFEAYFDAYFAATADYDRTDIFAISSLFSPSYQSLLAIARSLKRRYPGAIVMAGGNIPSNMYKELYKLDAACLDYICYGEGELPLLKFLEADTSPEARDAYVAASPSWVTAAKAADPTFLPAHDFISDLDEIPIYDYDLAADKYAANPAYLAYGAHQDTDLNFHFLTSRGCPYRCIFCASHKVHGRTMRYYSLERVKEDLRILKAKGAKTVIFQDDHFMGDQKRALEIVKYVGELGFKFIFQNSLALYALKREFLEACRDAGMDQLVLSVESGSDRVLKEVMKKPLNLRIVAQVARDCRELGIYTYCNIVMGLPGETKEDLEDSRRFLKTIYANWFGIFIANPLVGSEMFDICVENDFLQENWIGSDYKQAVVSTGDWDAEYIKNRAYQLNLELNIKENSDYRLGNYPVALQAFERVIRAKESHAVAYLMAARALAKLGRADEAAGYLEKSRHYYRTEPFWQDQMDQLGMDPLSPTALEDDAPALDLTARIAESRPPVTHFTNA